MTEIYKQPFQYSNRIFGRRFKFIFRLYNRAAFRYLATAVRALQHARQQADLACL